MPTSPPRPRLEAEGIGFTYRGRTPTRALAGLTLGVRENEFLAVLGPVGCGKTTLLRILAGFLRPDEGTVRCDGVPVDGPGPERGYVFQEDVIFPWMTVEENVEFGLVARNVAPAARKAVVAELIALIDLHGYERAFPKELSAGMSKMVEVVRVLATDPAILLLDEPFGSLDAQTRSKMQDEMARLWERRRKTVVFVTHDAEEALYLADRVVVFTPRPGRIKAEIDVDLPRPRTVDTRFAPDLAALKRRVWEAIG